LNSQLEIVEYMVINVISYITYPFIAYLLIFKINLGWTGIAYARIIIDLFIDIPLVLVILFYKKFEKIRI